jgi:uncharacterized protein (TIGR03437 family)
MTILSRPEAACILELRDRSFRSALFLRVAGSAPHYLSNMPVVFFLLVLSCGLGADTIAPREAPAYSGASIVNAADNLVEPLAPNTIATIYGKNLAYGTQTLTLGDKRGDLPTALPGSGVRILVGGLLANPFYVSPTQINFLVPPNLLPGATNVQIVTDSSAGPLISVQLAAASPALFQLDPQNAVATRADGSVITPAAPAKPGDVVVLYATGLGQTTPPIGYCELPWSAAWLQQAGNFRVVLDGVPLDQSAILYAGVAPFFAGLYQVNVILPVSTGVNPEVRIGLGETLSMPGLQVPVQP